MWRLIFRRRWKSALWKVKLCMCAFCATLGLTGLQAQFADIVSLLRSEEYTVAQLQAKLAAVKNDWQRTLQYIEQLESA